MKNLLFAIPYFFIWFICCFLISCADNDNTDPTAVTPEAYNVDYRSSGWGELPTMINSINAITSNWEFQLQEYLNAGIFSRMYMTASAGTYGTQPNNTQLVMTDGYNTWAASIPYQRVMPGWLAVYAIANSTTEPKGSNTRIGINNTLAIANVIKVASMHKVVDAFGPSQYIDYGKSKFGVPYDAVDRIYYKMINELSEADSILGEDKTPGSVMQIIKDADRIYHGNLAKWKKFANSLKLRLAMRMAFVDPTNAKKYAIEALNSGVIEVNDNNAKVEIGGNINPYHIYSNIWGEMRMSALGESILSGYQDPRLPLLFADAVGNIAASGKHKGIRFASLASGTNTYGNFSKFIVKNEDPIYLFNAAESAFLKAEAILRGFISGTAKDEYEKGIRLSFEQYKIDASSFNTYVTDNSRKPIDYIDPVNASNNIAASTDITIAWDEGDTKNIKLEKIITQKWIANIPNGAEGWAEYRRTGYPKVFPAVINLTPSTIDNTGPRRLPYTSFHRNSSADSDELEIIIRQSLGGKDEANVRIWWDVENKDVQ